MKIQVDGKQVLELSDIQKKVICNDIPDSLFQEDMERRVSYILTHKYERCLERLRKEWEPKLKLRMASFPSNDEAFAQVIFSQPDYKNREQRDELEDLKQ